MLLAAGTEGVAKVVTKFVELYPAVSKRQTEMKITEIAVKEKRASDSQKVAIGNYNVLQILFKIGMASEERI
jgi:hypothetical protein